MSEGEYVCPKCKGEGHLYIREIDDVVSCSECEGNGFLENRRSNLEERRVYSIFGRERRKNVTFTDRRKRI